MMLLDFTRKLDIISIVGAPVIAGDLLLNCGIVIQHGQILGIVPKTYLPNYSEFYEKRWFASAQDLRDCEVRYAGHKVKLTPDVQIFKHSMAYSLVWKSAKMYGLRLLLATNWR